MPNEAAISKLNRNLDLDLDILFSSTFDLKKKNPHAHCLTIRRLTVLAPIHLKSESNPPSTAPVKRNQAKIARYLWVFKFILDHSVSVTVAWKNLEL